MRFDLFYVLLFIVIVLVIMKLSLYITKYINYRANTMFYNYTNSTFIEFVRMINNILTAVMNNGDSLFITVHATESPGISCDISDDAYKLYGIYSEEIRLLRAGTFSAYPNELISIDNVYILFNFFEWVQVTWYVNSGVKAFGKSYGQV